MRGALPTSTRGLTEMRQNVINVRFVPVRKRDE
jgi:hypothetical protein